MYIDKKYMAIFIVWLLVCFFWKDIGLPRDLVKWLWWLPFCVVAFIPLPLFWTAELLLSNQKSNIDRFKRSAAACATQDEESEQYQMLETCKKKYDLQLVFIFIVMYAVMAFVAYQGSRVMKIPFIFLK